MIRPAFSSAYGAVYKTDCMNLFAALKDECVDTVFADPPFNLGKDYGHGSENDELEASDYIEWCHAWMDEAIRVIQPGGAIFVYNLPQWAYRLAVHLESKGMAFRHWIAVSMKGTFPRGRKLYPAHYALLYFTKGNPKTFNRDEVRVPVPKCRHCGKDIKDYGGHRKYLNPLGLNLTDFWEDTAPARHPKFKARWGINELKPLIPSRCIELTTHEGDVVLDPFGGGGSTYESAERLKRLWIGTEIVDCSLIAERFTRNVPEAAEGPPAQLSSLFKQPNSKSRNRPRFMPKIVEEIWYDGAKRRVERLGLTPLVDEVRGIIGSFQLLVKESVDSNGGAAVRRMLDAAFEEKGGWTKKTAGDIDWVKCKVVNGTQVCIGVEVQVSARSDLLVGT